MEIDTIRLNDEQLAALGSIAQESKFSRYSITQDRVRAVGSVEMRTRTFVEDNGGDLWHVAENGVVTPLLPGRED